SKRSIDEKPITSTKPGAQAPSPVLTASVQIREKATSADLRIVRLTRRESPALNCSRGSLIVLLASASLTQCANILLANKKRVDTNARLVPPTRDRHASGRDCPVGGPRRGRCRGPSG